MGRLSLELLLVLLQVLRQEQMLSCLVFAILILQKVILFL